MSEAELIEASFHAFSCQTRLKRPGEASAPPRAPAPPGGRTIARRSLEARHHVTRRNQVNGIKGTRTAAGKEKRPN
jgi:hypothetical protein